MRHPGEGPHIEPWNLVFFRSAGNWVWCYIRMYDVTWRLVYIVKTSYTWGLTETRRYLRHESLYKSCEWREKNWHHSSFIVLDFSFFSLGSVLASETPQTLYSHSIFLPPRNSYRLTHPQEHMCTTPIHKLPQKNSSWKCNVKSIPDTSADPGEEEPVGGTVCNKWGPGHTLRVGT